MKRSNWVIFFVNGLIAILFGLLALSVPVETIVTLTIYFGFVILIGGLIMFYFSYKTMKNKKPYLLLMAEAILAILIGAVIAFYPKGSLQVFLILVGIWASIIGLLQIIVAVQMRKKVSNHGMFTINGILTLVFGLLLFYNPMGAMKALFMVIGIIALISGVLLVYLGIKVRGIKE
jgi:uncharacterized membrane protein HdeD (DUF308 family)